VVCKSVPCDRSASQPVCIRMIRVAQVTDQKAVPLACSMRWSIEGHHVTPGQRGRNRDLA